LDDLSKQYETGQTRNDKGQFIANREDNLSFRGKPLSPEKRAILLDKLSKQETEDVNEKTAKKVNVSSEIRCFKPVDMHVSPSVYVEKKE